jgi:hypothetical protein
MSVSLQGTYTDSIKICIKAWKMRGPAGDGATGHFSDETVSEFIVVKHHEIGGPARTGIVFTLEGEGDEARRLAANNRRIQRCLESAQVVELIPSLLAALPADLASLLANELLRPSGRFAASLDDADLADITGMDMAVDAKESGESLHAVADYLANPTEANLKRVIKESNEAIEVKRGIVRKALAKMNPKTAYGKVLAHFRQPA